MAFAWKFVNSPSKEKFAKSPWLGNSLNRLVKEIANSPFTATVKSPCTRKLITRLAKKDDKLTCTNNGRIDGEGGQVGGQGSKVNDGVDGVPEFSTIIAQQLRNLLPSIVAQVGDQGRGQGNGRNQNGDAINDNIQGDVRNVIENNDYRGCTYKEFLACNPKEYDGKGAGSFVGKALTWWNFQICTLGREVVACMSWDNFKLLMREDFFPSNEMQKLETKLWNHTMVEAGHAAYTDRFHELARLVPQLVTSENRRIKRYVYGLVLHIRGMVVAMEPSTIQKAVQIVGTLTDEALRNRSIKKNLEKIGNRGEPSKNRNGKDDTGNDFATTTNPVRRECTGTAPMVPRNMNPINARNPTARACYECGSTAYVKAACPRGQGHGNNSNQARGRAFMLGAEEARQDLNIMTGIEPSDLGFSYEIEIAYKLLVEIDKVIKDCKLEIEGHVFDINLIPFRSGSFDVIIGMEWLSNHKTEIIYHEKTIHITPPDDNYVASATDPILNKHLNEFGEEFSDNTRVSEKINNNPVNNLKELLKTYDFENFVQKSKNQLSQSSHEI
ncbi:putative reverse transcriptase domain-containing protein, partial [Tanacetum coccineum]